jgi:hypothetical protein
MPSLLETLAGQLDDQTVSQISGQLGTDPAKTEQAITAALPMLLGALGRNANSQQGAQSLSNALKRNHDGSILNNKQTALAQPGTLEDGMKILGHVLGAKQNNVQTGVSAVSGLDTNSTGQLLALLAPMVLGTLGKMQKDQNLEADGLASLLKQDRDTTESSLGGLAKLLDMDGDGQVTDDMLVLGSSLLSGFFGRKKR